MSQKLNSAITVAGIDIGKNSFHVVGLDQRGAIVLRQRWSRGQVEARLHALRNELRRGNYQVLHCHHDLVSAVYPPGMIPSAFTSSGQTGA